MQIGVCPDAVRTAGALGDLGERAEQFGFDSFWVPDHLAFYGAPLLDPLQALACVATRTRRLRLGTSVYLLPLRHPTHVAKAVASLDFMSEGRVILGVGVGGEFPGEYAASGVPIQERGKRANEAIACLRHLWKEDNTPFTGRFFEVPELRLNPPPVSPGGPPIWIGGRSDAALRRAAKLGDGYLGFLLDAAGFVKRMETIHGYAREVGRAEHQVVGALVSFMQVDTDRDRAITEAAAVLSANYGQPMEAAMARYGIVGDIAACRETIRTLEQVGVEHLVLVPVGRGAVFDTQLDRVAEVIAALK
jgi:probable F420-dependent oxidoreductase